MKQNYTVYQLPVSLEYDTISNFINEFIFVPHGFGHQQNDALATCDWRIIGDFELIYTIDGESHITIGADKFICSKNQCMIIPPFVRHKIETPASCPHNNYWIHFDIHPFYKHTDFLSALFVEETNPVKIHSTQDLKKLYDLLEQEMCSAKPGSMIFFQTILVQIITTLLRNNARQDTNIMEKPYKQPPEAFFVNQVIDYIHTNIYLNIRPKDICSSFHVSDSYLHKAFAKILKMPPNNFIQMAKIKNAEQLMKHTHYSFKEISEMHGFSSPFYFSNVFKKYYKMSPREYMKIYNNFI